MFRCKCVANFHANPHRKSQKLTGGKAKVYLPVKRADRFQNLPESSPPTLSVRIPSLMSVACACYATSVQCVRGIPPPTRRRMSHATPLQCARTSVRCAMHGCVSSISRRRDNAHACLDVSPIGTEVRLCRASSAVVCHRCPFAHPVGTHAKQSPGMCQGFARSTEKDYTHLDYLAQWPQCGIVGTHIRST